MKRITKSILIAAGLLAVTIGVIGIIVPVLPTTPFLLLASFLFMRSSEKLYRKLLNSRVLGAYLRNYIQYRAISRRVKIISISTLWIALAVSAVLVDILYVRIILGAVGIGVTIHLLKLKTLENIETDTN